MATMLASCFALSGCGGGGGGQNEDGRKVSFLARIFGESDSSKQLGDTKKRELLNQSLACTHLAMEKEQYR